MRGKRNPQSTMLAFVNLDERVPPDHPLRTIKQVADDVLSRMSDDFDNMYSRVGRASVPPERLMRKGKGKEAKLVFMAHALMDNRHGLVSDFRLTEANGMAERDAALDMLIQIPGSRRLTVGADRGYDSRDFVSECRDLNITPHVAQKKRWSAIDGRTTCHQSYRASQKVRKRVESIFGWMKTVGGFRRSRYLGVERTGLYGELVATAYNLVRMSRLIGEEEAKVPIVA